MHGALDDRIRRFRIHDVEQNVNHFITPHSKNRRSQDLFRFRIDTNFHESLRLTLFVGATHAAHRIFGSQGTASGFSNLCVRHAASSERRINKQPVGLDPVGNPAMVSIEEIVRNDLVVVVGSMRKSAAAVAVAERPDAGHIRLQLVVNRYVAAMVGGNPSPVQSQVAGVRNPPHCQKNVAAQNFWRAFFAGEADGDATIETYTVRRDAGRPTGIIIGRLAADDSRFLSTTEDDELIALLTDGDPLGREVRVRSFDYGNRCFPR